MIHAACCTSGIQRSGWALDPPGGVWIGISGSPDSTRGTGSHKAVVRCRELEIDALEIAWVHRVSITESGAARVRQAAEAADVRLSVHAPYYINLNSADPRVVSASVERIVASGRAASRVGARDVVLHLAFNHGDPSDVVGSRVASGLARALDQLDALTEPVVLRAEVMGRHSQFGDLDEILRLCELLPGVAPCIDIAHLHARTGGYNSARELDSMWDAVAEALGPAALADVHVHISGIDYGDMGEKEHMALDDADLDYRLFLEVMLARGVRGLVIVESPAREDDVLLLKRTWAQVLSARAGAER